MESSIQLEPFISVDVETAGPSPGQYSLLSIGACTIVRLRTMSENGLPTHTRTRRPARSCDRFATTLLRRVASGGSSISAAVPATTPSTSPSWASRSPGWTSLRRQSRWHAKGPPPPRRAAGEKSPELWRGLRVAAVNLLYGNESVEEAAPCAWRAAPSPRPANESRTSPLNRRDW